MNRKTQSRHGVGLLQYQSDYHEGRSRFRQATGQYISEAIHSAMDLVAALIALFAVKNPISRPNERHPYGHDKIENVSGVINAAIFAGRRLDASFEAVDKLISPSPIESIGWGVLVMVISALVSGLGIGYRKVAREEESVALAAGALHLKADAHLRRGGRRSWRHLASRSVRSLPRHPRPAGRHCPSPSLLSREAISITRPSSRQIDQSMSPEELDDQPHHHRVLSRRQRVFTICAVVVPVVAAISTFTSLCPRR